MNIEAMARGAGFSDNHRGELQHVSGPGPSAPYKGAPGILECTFINPVSMADLVKFATLVRAAAMREAAGICEQAAWTHQNAPMLGPELNAKKCAAAILAAIDQPKA